MKLYTIPTLLALLLLSCGGPTNPPADTSAAVDTGSYQKLPTGDTTAQDQIDYTLRQNPAIASDQDVAPVVVDERPEEPVAVEAARPQTETVAPPPPTNSAPAPAPTPEASAPAPAPLGQGPDHGRWDELLRQYVSDGGRVDYSGLKENEKSLDEYLTLLSRAVPDDGWSRPAALAYWINAYNAHTVKLILINYPLQSIRDLPDPWKTEWFELAGKTYSLDNIEHDIVRPGFNEPRIHFALVCAASSCPPLANRAFTPANLERLLEERARSFINDERFNVTQEAVVRVSPLFDWYGEDFGDVTAYLNRYLSTDIPPGKELSFLEYDWSLND